jgi:hypothetical protein
VKARSSYHDMGTSGQGSDATLLVDDVVALVLADLNYAVLALVACYKILVLAAKRLCGYFA